MGHLIGFLKWLVGAVLVLALLGGGAFVFLYPQYQEYQARAAEAAKGDEVEVERAELGELTRTVSAPGTVQPRRSVDVTSRVSATIVRLPFEAGDIVEQGQIVCELDRNELEARLQAAEARMLADKASLKAAEASLASRRASIAGLEASLLKATADFERQQELFDSGDASESALESAQAELDRQRASYNAELASLEGVEANVEAARARVQVADADVKQARENLDYTVIRAPMSGVVTQVNSEEGEIVLGTVQNAGTVIMTIADLSEMLVNAEVGEVDAPKVKEGQAVKVYLNPYPDRAFTGELRRVGLQSRSGTDGTNVFDVEIVLDQADERMFAGLTANVDIEIENFAGLVVVPSQAVLDKRTDELPKAVRDMELVERDRAFTRLVFVYDEDAGTVHMRPVKVATSSVTQTALEVGINEGESIVTGPFAVLRTLRDGQQVNMMDPNEAAGDGNRRSFSGRPDWD